MPSNPNFRSISVPTHTLNRLTAHAERLTLELGVKVSVPTMIEVLLNNYDTDMADRGYDNDA